MSDNELRDRIAEAIMNPLTDRMGFVDGADDGSEVIQVDGFVDPREIAQAIIDEFGLTTEERLTEFGIDDPGYQERVVGKWEET